MNPQKATNKNANNPKETIIRFRTGWQTASRVVDEEYIRRIKKDIAQRHGREGQEEGSS